MKRLGMSTPRRPRAGRNAFTLMELMLVMVILSVLAAIVVPNLLGKAERARIQSTKTQIENIKNAIANFDINAGRLPTQAEGLAALVRQPEGLTDSQWPEKYMETMPKDGWGHQFLYQIPSQHDRDYDLISAGHDGAYGTSDDITNYEEGDGIEN